MKQKHSAFTLIELLVVIAIIAILAAILFPVFAQAKAAAKNTVDLSNLKQLDLAAIIYSNDFDDTLPGNQGGAGDIGYTAYYSGYINGALSPLAKNNWQRDIQPYVKSLPMEKSLLSVDLDGTDGWGCVNPDGSPTTLCSSYNKNGITDFKTTTAMPQPANTIIFQESLQLQKVSAIRPNLRNKTVGYATFDNAVLSYVYNTGGDFGWADGHAKYAQKSKIHFSDFGAIGMCVPDGSGVIPNYVGSGLDATQISMQPTKPDTGGSSFDDHDITCLNTAF